MFIATYHYMAADHLRKITLCYDTCSLPLVSRLVSNRAGAILSFDDDAPTDRPPPPPPPRAGSATALISSDTLDDDSRPKQARPDLPNPDAADDDAAGHVEYFVSGDAREPERERAREGGWKRRRVFLICNDL